MQINNFLRNILKNAGNKRNVKLKYLSDDTKDLTLKAAKNTCQCDIGHKCSFGVNAESYFIVNADSQGYTPATIRVICKDCFKAKHWNELQISIVEDNPLQFKP